MCISPRKKNGAVHLLISIWCPSVYTQLWPWAPSPFSAVFPPPTPSSLVSLWPCTQSQTDLTYIDSIRNYTQIPSAWSPSSCVLSRTIKSLICTAACVFFLCHRASRCAPHKGCLSRCLTSVNTTQCNRCYCFCVVKAHILAGLFLGHFSAELTLVNVPAIDRLGDIPITPPFVWLPLILWLGIRWHTTAYGHIRMAMICTITLYSEMCMIIGQLYAAISHEEMECGFVLTSVSFVQLLRDCSA